MQKIIEALKTIKKNSRKSKDWKGLLSHHMSLSANMPSLLLREQHALSLARLLLPPSF